MSTEVKLGDKAGDGTQLRPFIVWFGESVPEIETAVGLCGESGYIRHYRYFDECISGCRIAQLCCLAMPKCT